MNIKSLNLKLTFGIVYLILISFALYFLFSVVDIKDLMSYEFIKSNKEIISKYKNQNFLFLSIIFIIFSIVWVLLLGFALPLLIFSGFVFGKWWGILIAITSITIGATLLYILAKFFFKNIIEEKLAPKFSNLKKIFLKNDIFYYMIFRFIGGVPFAIQNIIPVLFDMSIRNYFFSTLLGCLPPMFVSVAIGSGLEEVIDQNDELSFFTILSSPEIYIPITAFIGILFIAYLIRKRYFKQ
jgi:uncharacterized membrane protein YdjX (TVP38/TMEM64 family)